jgi:DNA helicase-2/ATP-dependent DNA helicase PcrA
MNPTTQQQAFIDALINTDNHLTLRARAGCGKTSSILMGVEAYLAAHGTRRPEIQICAYNKAIATEIADKLKAKGYDWRQVNASTLHSLGYGLLRFTFKPAIDDKKVRNIAASHVDERDPRCPFNTFRNQIIALVGYAKQAGVGFFDDMAIGDARVWYHLADHFDVNGLDTTSDMDTVIECAQVVYRESLAMVDVIDFDDMILHPLVHNLRVKYTKDLIFVDEAQDLSRARQALARKFLRPRTGRMVIVGDDRQAIYGFSGADAASLDNLTRSLGAVVLPLSVTWRCPKAVVRLAQRLVPDLEAADNAPEGEVVAMATLPDDLGAVKDIVGKVDDAVLCRNTAPLVELAYKLIRQGKAVKVEGRKIGEGLINLAQRWKVRTTDALIKKLEMYQDREVQKAMAKGNEAKAEEVTDKVATLLEIISECNRQGRTSVDDVVEFVNRLFTDGAENVIVLATYHRAKGREWQRVTLWEHAARCPSRAAKQMWQIEQEDNLAYVAFTRAKETLVFVDPKSPFLAEDVV